MTTRKESFMRQAHEWYPLGTRYCPSSARNVNLPALMELRFNLVGETKKK